MINARKPLGNTIMKKPQHKKSSKGGMKSVAKVIKEKKTIKKPKKKTAKKKGMTVKSKGSIQTSEMSKHTTRRSVEIDRRAQMHPFKVKKVKQKKIGGRPTIMTQEIVNKLEDAFSYGATVTEACAEVGITRETYYQFVKKNPTFADRKEELSTMPFMVARRTLLSGIDKDPEISKWVLERGRKDEFSLKQMLEIEDFNVNAKVEVDPKTAKAIGKAMAGFMKMSKSKN